MTDQAYRYPKKTWTESEARAHCKDHSGISFEAASGTANSPEESAVMKSHTYKVITSPWAITEAAYSALLQRYNSYIAGEKVEKPAGGPGYLTIKDNIALISIEGIITKKPDIMAFLMGGNAPSQLIALAFEEALKAHSIHSIMLLIDSPGGTVDGTQELATTIAAGRGKKNIIAHTDGMMASAAYWIGAAADRVYISGDTTQVGSIGVVAAHLDVSRLLENIGIKITEIYSGKYKRIASAYEPLSQEGRQTIQDEVDYIYSVFVNDVAKYRGLSVDKHETWANGRIFTGKQAVKAGLVDGVKPIGRLMKDLSTMKDPARFARKERVEAQIELDREQRRLACQTN